MPFKFSLQEVLDYRGRIEEVRQGEMLAARRQVEYVENVLERARGRRFEYREEMNRLVGEGAGFARQELFLNYIEGLDRMIKGSVKHLEELRGELERRRERLLEAAREREVLDELKKQEAREYLVAERRLEDKEYNEMSIRNFLLAQREKSARSAEGAPS